MELLTTLREQKAMRLKGTDTCLTAQDDYKSILDYFQIAY